MNLLTLISWIPNGHSSVRAPCQAQHWHKSQSHHVAATDLVLFPSWNCESKIFSELEKGSSVLFPKGSGGKEANEYISLIWKYSMQISSTRDFRNISDLVYFSFWGYFHQTLKLVGMHGIVHKEQLLQALLFLRKLRLQYTKKCNKKWV